MAQTYKQTDGRITALLNAPLS